MKKVICNFFYFLIAEINSKVAFTSESHFFSTLIYMKIPKYHVYIPTSKKSGFGS